jgi:hypothetical protein
LIYTVRLYSLYLGKRKLFTCIFGPSGFVRRYLFYDVIQLSTNVPFQKKKKAAVTGKIYIIETVRLSPACHSDRIYHALRSIGHIFNLSLHSLSTDRASEPLSLRPFFSFSFFLSLSFRSISDSSSSSSHVSTRNGHIDLLSSQQRRQK